MHDELIGTVYKYNDSAIRKDGDNNRTVTRNIQQPQAALFMTNSCCGADLKAILLN